MAFWQTNTWFQPGIWNSPFNTGFSTGFTWSATKSTGTNKKKDDYTYNSRYPWFDENDYKRLVEIVKAQGVTGTKFDQLMDEAYQFYYPQVLNKHKLAERDQTLNNTVYENGDLLLNGEWDANEKIKLTQLSQKAKEKYNIPYDYPDEDLLKMMEEETPDWNKLLYDYVNNGSDEIFYKTWIYDQKQGGIKSLINPASEGGILPESQREWVNPVGYGTETLDNAATKFADKLTVRGTNSAENLKNEIDNMSQEEIDRYRKIYNEAVKDKDIRVATVEWNSVVGRLWNAIKWNLKYDYEDEDFIKRVISQKANLGQSLIGADDILRGESNPNVIRFFSNIPASAVKTFTATVRWMTNPYDTLKGLYKLAATEEWHQALLQRYGSWDALAEAMNTDPVGVADDMLAVAELGTNIAKWGLKFTGKVTGNQGLLNAANTIEGRNIGSANDALAQKTVWKVYGWLDKLADMSNNKLVQGWVRYAEDVSSISKLLENGKADLEAIEQSKFWQSLKDAYNEAVNKMVGIDEEDRKFIRENKDLVNETLSKKRNTETIYETVQEKLSDKALEKTEMGKEYDNLSKSKKKVVLTDWITNDKDLQKLFKKGKISIDEKWNLVFDKLSEYNPTQQKAIQDAWEIMKNIEDSKKLDAGTTISQRKKIDDKINREWKSQTKSSVDIDAENLIKQMRKTVDSRAKTYIPWLKELDAKYEALIDEVNQMKKDWFNPDGTIKDNARSKIRNLTKAGNEAKLERLESIAPGITQDLKALDVALTVEKASKQGVGQYSRSILEWSVLGWVVHPGLWVAWAVLRVLSSPKVYVRLIEDLPDIAQKISAGQELLPSDYTKLTSWASRIQDGMEIEQ